jgi:hypothetical protein
MQIGCSTCSESLVRRGHLWVAPPTGRLKAALIPLVTDRRVRRRLHEHRVLLIRDDVAFPAVPESTAPR